MPWEDEFRHRMDCFREDGKGFPVSIKVRVDSGCYHREHSPNAYRQIDECLRGLKSRELSFMEHESGPEVLAYIALTTAGASLAASVINLVTTIIKARAEGIKKGDHPCHPVELIVRGFGSAGNLEEEKILRFAAGDKVTKAAVKKALLLASEKISKHDKKRGHR